MDKEKKRECIVQNALPQKYYRSAIRRDRTYSFLAVFSTTKSLYRGFSKSVNGFIIYLTESSNGGDRMNERFFSLPAAKQQAIINAGYRVFSQNSYKNSPMSEIAAAAGISKSLLFHYFHNKLELYLFLWENCAKTTIKNIRI